jgi:hypothetical protein
MKPNSPSNHWLDLLDEISLETPEPPPPTRRKRPSPYLLGALGILCVVFIGTKISANSERGPKGRTINGTVSYKGKTVVFGAVVIIDSDGLPKAGSILPDGTFSIEKVISSTPKIAVSSPPPPGAKVAAAKGRDAIDPEKKPSNVPQLPPEVAKNWFPLPDNFGEHHRSGITTEIQNDVLEISLK